MRNWNQLFIRHGWLLVQKANGVFDCTKETSENVEFLFQSLEKANIHYKYDLGKLSLCTKPMVEEDWIKVLDFEYRGRGEGLWFRPGAEQPKVAELDTYISGIVRQLNRLGFYTMGSCDGHDKRLAHVMVTMDCDQQSLKELLHSLVGRNVQWQERRNHAHLSFRLERLQLLDLAERLSLIDEAWVKKGSDFINEQNFRETLYELLMIPGVSGEEELVRDCVIEKLTPFVDHITVDHAGNILAEKTYNHGNGPTILLNAHLDTVYEIEADREIIKEENLWYSSTGILGADDRAGVTVLLHLAEHLSHNRAFSGKVKFIFTVEEEQGLIGASQVDKHFLWGTDAAIVVDRRGDGDIVTSCGGHIPFCDSRYGLFFEEVAASADLKGWAVTKGGSSDTRIWASHGIQSVNLSAGYNNEHTSQEILDVEACYNTAKLLKAVFTKGRDLKRLLRQIKQEENIVIMSRKKFAYQRWSS
ncbi:M20/M25/M40 family metallo-hydrolase [Bacillus sp. MRMR6]|uniref:M20/M25/M40 family metallo-hydrolase n=1 Tax=Bacillus sp. MRMR6 TaxID=1928617 RepID=UPI00095229CC|nr:M20/M25/M40 family metallo-hydrolase [Bacillus sp. MRMR6]OLS35566.1 peptidase M28 [Bacillus sp. MRMR6]